jgi:DNA-nicking Smr family endonuclease
VKRPLRPDELKLWSVVAATIRPAAGRATSRLADPQRPPALTAGVILPAPDAVKPRGKPAAPPPDAIEPNRKRRIERAREDIGARLDLHGMDQDRARATLHAFVLRAHADGVRAILVITGKGTLGDGILRRRTPEWLAEPAVRAVVAGVSEAARTHGGAGALYVALKRRG